MRVDRSLPGRAIDYKYINDRLSTIDSQSIASGDARTTTLNSQLTKDCQS
ncbi:MAG: hypothetical protein ACRC62_25515 [Microcoleus sp.]